MRVNFFNFLFKGGDTLWFLLIQIRGKLKWSSRIYLGLSAPFRILSQAYLLNETFRVFQALSGSTSIFLGLSTKFKSFGTIQQPSGTFSDYQDLLATLPASFWAYQQHSTTFRSIQPHPGPFQGCTTFVFASNQPRLTMNWLQDCTPIFLW